MMANQIHKVVVIGAGTMGAAIAAHLANVGVSVTLLDIVPRSLTPDEEAAHLTLKDKKVRNRIVNEGWDRCLKTRPANLMAPEIATLVKLGNLEDDFGAIANADWILEAVVENLRVKQDLMARIDSRRKPDAIVSTNTSGIPIKDIAAGRSKPFKEHFLGTHFFNPPRYLKLLEIIPIQETSPEIVKNIAWFGEFRLGKGVVVSKDSPNFIANRVAFGTGAFALDYILKKGYSVEEVDSLTGPLLGRPKTATFRLIDLVGVDVWEHVGENLKEAIPYDTYAMPALTAEKPAKLVHSMIERDWLGNKTKVGFYKAMNNGNGKEYWPLDLKTLEHVAPSKPRFDSVGKAKDIKNLSERLKVLFGETDRAAQLIKTLMLQDFQYASVVIPEVADSPKPIDDAIRWGFMHEAGPFEIWDSLGVRETVEEMEKVGFPPAGWIAEMLQSGCKTFYQYKNGHKVGVYDVTMNGYIPIPKEQGLILLSDFKKNNKIIAQNSSASLYDIGDGIELVEFHTKMNSLDEESFAMMEAGLDRAEKEFDGVVVGNNADNFCAGANIALILMAAKSGQWDTLTRVVRRFQKLNMRMRYFPKPVVIAPAGLTLGGGCEITMHGSRAVAAGETYIGLVELGVGVIPAGGGTKEMMRRIVNPVMRIPGVEVFPLLQKVFEQIGQAKVSTSAEEARNMRILGAADRIVFNRDHLLAEAKKEALCMASAGYHPPAPEMIYAGGRDALAALRIGAWAYKEARYISEYDNVIAAKLANVLSGGDLSRPSWVSEEYILDLECEAFLSLCGEERTQARLFHMLQTGKPLRN
jgi:3-hydroxyacyl-CoA dehydrogenase